MNKQPSLTNVLALFGAVAFLMAATYGLDGYNHGSNAILHPTGTPKPLGGTKGGGYVAIRNTDTGVVMTCMSSTCDKTVGMPVGAGSTTYSANISRNAATVWYVLANPDAGCADGSVVGEIGGGP